MTTLDVRPAHPDEFRFCSQLLIGSARWASANGVPMWPEHHLTVDALTRQYEPAEFRLGWLDGEPVATMVMQRTDSIFWPDDAPGEALYLHKLAVSRNHAGQGFAWAMLQAAVEETRKTGRPFLRLDTAAERPKLRALYEGFGFTERGTLEMGGFLVVLYELQVD